MAGVALMDCLQREGWLAAAGNTFTLTDSGAEALNGWGLDGAAWRAKLASPGERRQAYGCLDWSERRDHLAGPLASALLTHFIARGWLRRQPGERALVATPTGRQALAWWPVTAD
jgi:hypothetical protein